MSEVLLTREGPVATITINRPEIRNAIGPSVIAQLTQLFQVLSIDDTRIIVLTGAGTAFSAGADIDWMRASRELTMEANVADAAAARKMFETVDSCLKPVVARINGPAKIGALPKGNNSASNPYRPNFLGNCCHQGENTTAPEYVLRP